MISIWFSAETYFNDNLYLSNPETPEEKFVVQNDLFIMRTRYMLGVMTVLQINKLFGGKNDDFSFKKFLDALLNSHEDSEWKDKISIELIKEWKKQLNEQIITNCIKKVNVLRNQYFAHSDRNPEPFENLIMKSEEMKELLKFCEDILLKISVDVFKQYYHTETADAEKANGILKRLSVHVIKKQY
jgi:hypothetical protein